jgi:hypothetical protein
MAIFCTATRRGAHTDAIHGNSDEEGRTPTQFMTIQRKRGAQTQFHSEEEGCTDAIPFKMRYNLQEHDIEPSGEELHPSIKADRSCCQDDKETQP